MAATSENKPEKQITMGILGACGCGKDDTVRGDFIYLQGNPEAGTCGSPGCIFRYEYVREKPGNHDLFETGRVYARRVRNDVSGYSGTCGLFGGDGENVTGTRLCDPSHQRSGRCAGTYRDTVAAAFPLSDSGFLIYQQNGSAGNRSGSTACRSKGKIRCKLCGVFRRSNR